ncbi:MAG: 3-deoxy-7-phosphoheptulonate synthase, partial [Oscillospiraceae bacterium]|nr:3-deoxy-7-phosphoheptulonate synthase [Oscillospiraceae bacterium]
MVIVLKRDCTTEQLQQVKQAMERGGVKVMVSQGAEVTILGAEGNASGLNQEALAQLPGVERVVPVTEPYKKANRKYHPEDTVVDIGRGVKIGGRKLAVIAGPCSVESQEQIVGIARSVQTAGAAGLRG